MSACHRRLAAIVGACVLAGCATPPRVTEPVPAEQVSAADLLDDSGDEGLVPGTATREEIVRILAQRYPPAQTRLAIRGAADDSLGRALVASFRRRGYAVAEGASRAAGAADGLPLGYRFARIEGDPERYALSVSVGPTRLSRIYVRGHDGRLVVPDGAWSLRE